MNKDSAMEEQNEQYQKLKENTIQAWIINGASRVEAEQLYKDMENDPAYADPDRNDHDDSTIDERLAKYSGKAKQ